MRTALLLLFAVGALFQTNLRGADLETPLADAAEHQHPEAIQELLAQGCDVNAAQPDGMTPLLWSVYHEDEQSTRLLIEAGASVNQANRYGATPLSLACSAGNERLVNLLLEAKADPDLELPGGETCLMTAARAGRLGPVQALLKHSVELNAREWQGQTALMWAAAEGHTAVVQALLEAGADRTLPLKSSGFTALFFAVREGRIDTTLALLAAGDDVNTVMQPERQSGKGPRQGMSPLLMAVENGHFDLALALLKAGADPNDQRSGFTALHTITWVRKPNRGDDPDGDPSPIGSGTMSSLQFVRELVAHGADINLKLEKGRGGRGRLNQTGATPFLMAADTADVPLMKVLLELGADPDLRNADDCTPLLAAAGIGTFAPGEEAGTEEEALEAVRLLLDLGGDINHRDENGETAMHGAAYASFPAMAHLLHERGADIAIWNQKNKYGWTPLRIAQGDRPGNFKPAAETITAISSLMRERGVEIPAAPIPNTGNDEYKAKPPAKPTLTSP